MEKIINSQFYSQNFPKKVDKEIIRDNIITTIKNQLENADIVIINGDEEIGKTTFMSQFANNNYENTISCFLRPINQFSTNLENIIYNFLAQIHWIINHKEIPEDIIPNLETLSHYFNLLNRKSRNKIVYYIIIDGLEDIDDKNSYLLKELFNVLPFGYSIFKFLFSDNNNKIEQNFLCNLLHKERLACKSYPFSGFSLDELLKYFEENGLSIEQASEILKITNGLPGRIKNINQILKQGKTIDSILQNIDNYSDILEYQLNGIDSNDSDLITLIALVSLEEKEYTVKEVSLFLNISIEKIKEYINKFTFWEIDFDKIVFKSSTLKKYIKNKYSDYKTKIDEAIIQFLISNPNDISSIIELPKRYEKIKRFEDILSILTEDNFKKIIEQKESLSFVEEQTEVGVTAAFKLNKYTDLFKLSLLKSCITEIKQTYIWETEIEAKIELKDFNNAYRLVQQTILKEDKFRLLVFLAKKKKEKGLIIEQEILDLIKVLYQQINPKYYQDTDEIIEIAINLLYTFPEYAIELLDKTSGINTSATKDIGFASLIILLKKIRKSQDDETNNEKETINNISSRIKDPKIKNLANAFSYLFDDDNIENFITQINEITDLDERLQIIRIYLSENPKQKNVDKLIYYALDILLKGSVDIPINASILEELSISMPHIDNLQILSDLINKFDTYKSISKERGPTIKHIRFLLHLASSELKINFTKAQLRFYEISFDIDKINDLGLKTEALSILFSTIKRFDKESKLENSDNFESTIYDNIDKNYNKLLIESAEHYKITKRILKEICRVIPIESFNFINKINTKHRRENSLLTGLKAYLRNEFSEISFTIINKYYKQITDPKIKNIAIIEIFEKFKKYKTDTLVDHSDIISYFDKIKDFITNKDKCYAYILILSIINNSSQKNDYLDNKYNEIITFWDNLESKFDKIDYGFKFSSCFLNINKLWAKEFHDKSEKEKESLELDSPISLRIYYNCLKLSIKAFIGIFKNGISKEEDVNILIEYIKFLPSKTKQIKLISNLLIRIYDPSNKILFNKLFEEQIKPFISIILKNDDNYSRSEKINIIFNISIITYLYHKDLCMELLKLPILTSYSDFCYDNICDYLITKRIDDEPYKFNEKLYKIKFEDALSVIELLNKISTDHLINERINELYYCQKNHSFTREQLPIICENITKLINNKFPDINNIKHQGYVILSKAYLYKLDKRKVEKDWIDLVDEANKIPNISDKSLVLSILASLIPEGCKIITKNTLLNDALKYVENISSYESRVARYNDIKSIIKDVNLNECKESLKKAINDSINENNTDLYNYQKSIIDFAYDFDEKFAEDLLKIIDNDPARKIISSKLEEHLETLKLNKDLKDNKLNNETYEIKQLSKVSEMFLASLNSDKANPKHIEKLSNWLISAHNFPIYETYNIYSAYLENACYRVQGQHSSIQFLKPFFDYTIKIIQLVKVLAIKSKNKKISYKDIIITSSSNHLIVNPGDKEKALDFIRSWINNNVNDYIKICDPYFTSEDILLIKEISHIKPNIKIQLLSHFENGNLQDIISDYKNKWKEISDENPPDVSIVMVGYKLSGKCQFLSPNHDRWYITGNSGLRVGTSFNSLGITQNSEISIMSSSEAKDIEVKIIDKYLNREESFHNSEKLTYFMFDL